MSEHKSNESQPRTTADERERFNRVATLVRDESIIPCPLPSHPRTVRVDPKTLVAAWPLEPGDELIVRNESGIKIEVEAGTLSHGRVQRINELVKERDALYRLMICRIGWNCYVTTLRMTPERHTTEKDAIAAIRKAAGLDNESEAGE